MSRFWRWEALMGTLGISRTRVSLVGKAWNFVGDMQGGIGRSALEAFLEASTPLFTVGWRW